MVKFSIIIPVKEINEYIRKFVPLILKQTFEDFEIIVIPDSMINVRFEKTRVIASRKVGPAKKRDMGAKIAKGEILAFIDDDAYPDRNWLKNALEFFKDKEVAAVGGPNLTPEKSNYFQRVSGAVLSSYMVSGPTRIRYILGSKRDIDDWPSCNLFIRRTDFLGVGGFSTNFWPGEDTKLCLDIKKSGKRVLYSPKVVVYHHRRENLRGYLKQIFSYAVHRGFFAKRYPETSLKLTYFIPSLFFIFLIFGGVLSIFNAVIANIYLFVLVVYLLLIIIEALRTKKVSYIISFVALTFITHITYGIGLIGGLFKRNLVSKYNY